MFKKAVADPTIQKMQYAGIKQALDSLKDLKEYEWCDVAPIIHNIKSILNCYNCRPSKYLKKRIKHIIYMPSYAYLEDSVKILSAELEEFLKSTTEPKITIVDTSIRKI